MECESHKGATSRLYYENYKLSMADRNASLIGQRSQKMSWQSFPEMGMFQKIVPLTKGGQGVVIFPDSLRSRDRSADGRKRKEGKERKEKNIPPIPSFPSFPRVN